MKPAKFKKLFQRALNKRIRTYDNSLLLKLKRDIAREIRRHRKWCKDHGFVCDDRTGEQTLGYNNPDGTLKYLQDRWDSDWRLRWILDGLNNERI